MLEINKLLISLITFAYACRGIVYRLGRDRLPIYLTAILILVNLVFISGLRVKRSLLPYLLFVYIGITLLCLGVLRLGIIRGSIGFAAFFMNLIAWFLVYNNIREDRLRVLFQAYIDMNIIFACVNAILGVYQYFIDPSLFGFAFHEIYGNEALMNSGLMLRRVTALLGSPQNYSLYLALATSLVSFSTFRRSSKYLAFVVMATGGVLSGSRSYSLFLMMVLGVNLGFRVFTTRIRAIEKFGALIGVVLFVFLVFSFSSMEWTNDTISRLFVFFRDWPAFQIYVQHLQSMHGTDFLLGKGMGYNERLVATFMNVDGYRSFESYILSLFVQGGVLALMAFVYIYGRTLRNCRRSGEIFYYSILVALLTNLFATPSFNGLPMSFIAWPIILYPTTFSTQGFGRNTYRRTRITDTTRPE